MPRSDSAGPDQAFREPTGRTRSDLIHWPLHARRGVAPIKLASPRRPDLPNGVTALAVPRRVAGGLRATVAGGDGAPPSRAHAPRPLSRGDRRGQRRRRRAALHRARVPRLPRLRGPRPRLRPRAVRRLPVRAPRPVLLQGTRRLPELRRPAHGRAGGAPRRRRAAVRPRAPVGAHRAASPALPSRVRSRALSRRAGRVHPRSARLVPAAQPARRRPGRPERDGHRRAALRERVRTQRALSRARARRGVRPRGGRDAPLPPPAAAQRRRRRPAGGDDRAAGRAAARAPRARRRRRRHGPAGRRVARAGRTRERGRAGPDRARAPRRGTGRAPRCRPRCPWVESSQPLQARCDGFDLHGAVTVAGQDRDRLEQLCRYLLRPPIAQERLALRPDGTVLVTLQTPWRDGTTHRCFEPVTPLERLAALTPRPRINVVLYHGVLAPRAKWRASAVTYGRADAAATQDDAASMGGPVAEAVATTSEATPGPAATPCSAPPGMAATCRRRRMPDRGQCPRSPRAHRRAERRRRAGAGRTYSRGSSRWTCSRVRTAVAGCA